MIVTYASITTNLSCEALELISLKRLSQILKFYGCTGFGRPSIAE